MYIKYNRQIFNLKRQKSLICAETFDDYINNEFIAIYAIYLDDNIKITFDNKNLRDAVFTEIWDKLILETKHLDLDKFVKNLLNAKKFKLI